MQLRVTRIGLVGPLQVVNLVRLWVLDWVGRIVASIRALEWMEWMFGEINGAAQSFLKLQS